MSALSWKLKKNRSMCLKEKMISPEPLCVGHGTQVSGTGDGAARAQGITLWCDLETDLGLLGTGRAPGTCDGDGMQLLAKPVGDGEEKEEDERERRRRKRRRRGRRGEEGLFLSLLVEKMFFQQITVKSQMKYKPHELFGLLGIQESFSVWTRSQSLWRMPTSPLGGTPFLWKWSDPPHPTPTTMHPRPPMDPR